MDKSNTYWALKRRERAAVVEPKTKRSKVNEEETVVGSQEPEEPDSELQGEQGAPVQGEGEGTPQLEGDEA